MSYLVLIVLPQLEASELAMMAAMSHTDYLYPTTEGLKQRRDSLQALQ